MKHTKRVIHFRRKREGRTDYRARLSLLKSKLPRLVVRKSNKNMMLQVINYQPDGDKVLATALSVNLKDQGWKHSTSSIPAAYLTGLMLAKKLKLKDEIIVDIGLQVHKKGSRIYAAVKGALDGGLKIRCSEDIFPSEDRLSGKHINKETDFETVKKKIMG